VFKRRRAERFELLAQVLRARLDEQSRQLVALGDAVSALTVETTAGAREARALELLIATQLDLVRSRLSAVTQICERLGERAELDRLERLRLTEALIELTRAHTDERSSSRAAVPLTVLAIDDGLDDSNDGIVPESATLTEPAAAGPASTTERVADRH
jgi:hypothetical protein